MVRFEGPQNAAFRLGDIARRVEVVDAHPPRLVAGVCIDEACDCGVERSKMQGPRRRRGKPADALHRGLRVSRVAAVL